MAASIEKGVPLPKAYRDAPFLEDAYQHSILNAFWRLSTCRQIGQGIGPIPWSAIDQWIMRHGYMDDQVERDTFLHLIYELDAVFMTHQLAEYKRETSKHGKSGPVRSAHGSPRLRSRRRGR